MSCPPGPPPYVARDVSEVYWKGTPSKRQLRRWKSEFAQREAAKEAAAGLAAAAFSELDEAESKARAEVTYLEIYNRGYRDGYLSGARESRNSDEPSRKFPPNDPAGDVVR